MKFILEHTVEKVHKKTLIKFTLLEDTGSYLVLLLVITEKETSDIHLDS